MITVHNYVAYMRKTLQSFEDYWRRMSREEPKNYLEELSLDDWNEQFGNYLFLFHGRVLTHGEAQEDEQD